MNRPHCVHPLLTLGLLPPLGYWEESRYEPGGTDAKSLLPVLLGADPGVELLGQTGILCLIQNKRWMFRSFTSLLLAYNGFIHPFSEYSRVTSLSQALS